MLTKRIHNAHVACLDAFRERVPANLRSHRASWLATFARVLRQTRIEAGCSIGALAAASGIGKSTLEMWEAGTRVPSLARLWILAQCLNVDVRELLP